jgi:Fur family ferric uptake transcriptional regulator
MTCHQSALAELQKQGMRLTAQRALILEYLFHHPGHHTAEAIYRRASSSLPGLNRATIYRTLEMLHAAHIVAASAGPDGVMQFELAPIAEEPHHHLHCRRCGRELPLDTQPLDDLRRAILDRCGFEADFEHLIISGLCATCAGQPGGEGPASAAS